jgi:hypothetical protein
VSGFLTVGPVEAREWSGGSRIEAAVDGESLSFESAETVLEPSPEAIAGCALMAAVAGRRTLAVADRVDATWLGNMDRMLRIWNRWWGYPVRPIRVGVRPAVAARARKTALCFTGGVDSFYTLLCGPTRPDVVAYVRGYDMSPDDEVRWSSFEPSFREVACDTGAHAVVLRTELRRHHALSRLDWSRAHGGLLAAIGHLLSGEVGRLLVSSSYTLAVLTRWGSHPGTDPLWSSDRVEVVHVGVEHSRISKIRAISGHELARHHLRVCWENRSASGNCSRCDKCVSTMVFLATCVEADRLPTFDWSGSLADRLDRLPGTRFGNSYRELLAGRPDRRLAAAIRALLRRTALGKAVGNRARPVLDRLRALRVWREAF